MNQVVNLIPVRDTITTAWEKTWGAKGTFWKAIGVIILVVLAVSLLETITFKMMGSMATNFIGGIGNIFISILQFGLIYIGICRAADREINYRQVFYVFDWQLILYLVGLYIIQFLIVLPVVIVAGLGIYLMQTSALLGGLLFAIGLIGGIIITIRLFITIPLVLDQRAKPLEAIQRSFYLTHGNFWHLLGISLIQFIIVVLSMIPLLLGLIWTIPFAFITYGLIYRRLVALPVVVKAGM